MNQIKASPTMNLRRFPADTVRYGLRFQILPGPEAISRAKDVVKFCRLHGIRAVHLFTNAEEWNRGHLTGSEIAAVIAMFKRILPLFRRAGISVNLNPWQTTLHADRGRRLRAGQKFECMVAPSGRVAQAVASFACPRWRKAIADFYHRMASLGFGTLWIEDDFRYHNHEPLDWGGDFSGAMLKQFSAKVGRSVTRQQVLKAVLKPGQPHPWRRLWLELWRENQESVARLLAQAVESANPRATLGLMSSHPDVHAAEGRRWDGLFKAMSIRGRAIHRPHFAPYNEAVSGGLISSFNLLDQQRELRPRWVESHPEIENFPFGRFNKSDTSTFAQMALCKILGSEGLLLDLHPFVGNGVFEEQGIGQLLDRARPALEWLSARFSRDLQTTGVGVPFREDVAEQLRLPAGATYGQLVCSSGAAGLLLGGLGIACQRRLSESVNVLWGQNAWAYSDAEVRELLRFGLWLDAGAADILCQRGFGRQLGIRIGNWMNRETDAYAVERVVSARTGVRPAFHAGANLFQRVLRFEAAKGAETWTDIVDFMNRRVGTGLSVFANEWGGRVAVSAFPLNEELGCWNFNFQRQTLAQNLIRRLAGRKRPAMTDGAPHLFPIDLRNGGERKIVAINLWTDPAPASIRIPGATRLRRAIRLDPLSGPKPVPCRVQAVGEGLHVKLSTLLPSYGMAILEMG
ncbi:MAG: hypothetical protein HY343_10520 [Lentisphaerae bacterium]|nr:hypothetical protein [Lentisphaerota bacterium]